MMAPPIHLLKNAVIYNLHRDRFFYLYRNITLPVSKLYVQLSENSYNNSNVFINYLVDIIDEFLKTKDITKKENYKQYRMDTLKKLL